MANLLIIISGVTILYGNLCAIPQRNLKRLLGYSSIAHAGYMLLGIAGACSAGQAAVRHPLLPQRLSLHRPGRLHVICLVMRQVEGEDITALAGLNQRSPLLAATMTLAMVSLAGIPPLAGFFGKFLADQGRPRTGPAHPAYYWLVFIAMAGVVISLYYYFGVVRAIYWSRDAADLAHRQFCAHPRFPLRLRGWNVLPRPLPRMAGQPDRARRAVREVTAPPCGERRCRSTHEGCETVPSSSLNV